MKIIFAFIPVLLYWVIDSYIDMKTFHLSFQSAVLLDYPQANLPLKGLISVIILFFVVIGHRKKEEDKKNKNILSVCTNKMMDTMQSITDTILAPIPLLKQVNQIVQIIEDKLNIKTVFIGSYKSDFIELINTNSSLGKFGIKDKFLPHRDDFLAGSLEEFVSIFYIEKREFEEREIKISEQTYRVILSSFRLKNSKKHMGFIGFIIDKNDKDDYKNFLSMLGDQIAFIMNLTQKRIELVESQEKFKSQFSPIDPDLKIFNSSKLGEILESERKRAKRYGTALSLILIEIDHMKNLTNIFGKDEMLRLKKEFAKVFKKEIRETDVFGKWSKDEQFAIVAPNIDFRGAKNFALKLDKKLKEHRFPKVGRITCSYGVTSYSNKDNMFEFQRRAEKALNEAVKKGGNSIEVKILI